MKNNYSILSVVSVPLFAIPVLLTAGTIYQNKSTSADNSAIPDDLYRIFEKSCMGCHSKGGNLMAMTHLNFTNWDKYKPPKKASVAADICKMITKGAMPPKSARASNPGSIPTQAQINSICEWTKSLNAKK